MFQTFMRSRRKWAAVAAGCAIIFLISCSEPERKKPDAEQKQTAAAPTAAPSPSPAPSAVPLDQVQTALAAAAPGDTILVASGTYTDLNLTLTFTSDKLTTVKAAVPGGVVLKGSSIVTIKDSVNLRFSGFYFDQVKSTNSLILDHSSRVEVDNNYFDGNGSKVTGKIVLVRNGSADNKIHHNTFDGSKGQGVSVVNAGSAADAGNTGNDIYNNLFYNIPSAKTLYPESNGNGLEAVQLGQGSKVTMKLYAKVHDNLFEKVTGDGAEIISSKTSNNDIYRNTFLNNNSGLTVRLGESNKVYGNYLENTKYGIRVYGYDHLVENNYVKGGQVGIQLPAGDTVTGPTAQVPAPYYQADHVKVKGNVVVNPSYWAFLLGGKYKADTTNLLPIGAEFADNQIYIASTAVDYERDASVTVPFDPLPGFAGNKSILKSTANKGKVSTTDAKQIEYSFMAIQTPPNPQSITGTAPFTSKDPLTGASWKRPQ